MPLVKRVHSLPVLIVFIKSSPGLLSARQQVVCVCIQEILTGATHLTAQFPQSIAITPTQAQVVQFYPHC